MENKKIVLLVGKGVSSNIVFHALNNKFNIYTVIAEEKESKRIFISRRIKKLGVFKVVGQVLFQLLVVPALNFYSKKEISLISKEYNLNDDEIAREKILNVKSINEDSVAHTLASIQPDVIVVNGTRIISKKILSVIKCPVINTHAGITPMYRGVHGAYWAMVNKEPEHCGVTVHLIDAGIDTGDVVYQSLISVERSDTFATYPLKQLAAGIPLLTNAVEDALAGNIKAFKPFGKSGLWYHPTIWQYFYHLIFRRIK
ncbi:MAG: formyl transferase [Ferruginibacter sp.]